MKNNINITSIIFISFIFLFSNTLKSQNDDFEKGLFDNWSININIGNSQYFGDISNGSDPFSLIKYNTSIAGGLIVSKQITPVFGLRSQFIRGRLVGRKENYSNGAPANLSFDAQYFELNLNTTVDLFNIIMKYKKDRLLGLYGIFGLGLSNYQGEARNYKTNLLIRSFGHGKGGGIGGWQVEGTVYIGGGAKVRLSNSFDATAEIGLKIINNDQLDGMIGGFKYDMYSYNGIGISYKFGNAEKKKKIIFQEPKIEDIEPFKEVEKKEEVVIKEEPKVIEPVKTETKIEKTEIVEKKTEPLPVIAAKPTQEFKVQVMASATKVDPAFIQKKFNINEPIREDYDGVWYRYSVGSFQEYWKAKEEAKKLISKNNVYGAFVVGIKDGKRLNSVKEMLTKDENNNLRSNFNKSNASNIGIGYRIQVIALKKKLADEAKFKQEYQITQEMFEEFLNNLYIYTVGNYTDFNEAVMAKNNIKKNGISDAFIVTFKNNKRISITESAE